MSKMTYYIAENLKEAHDLMTSLDQAVYLAGASEVTTFMRKNTLKPNALIDLNKLDGIKVIRSDQDLVIGACVTLNDIIDFCKGTMMEDVYKGIGDHTVRNAITLGGNICGRLPYKEGILPLLALNADVVIMTQSGLVRKPARQAFDKRLRLNKGDFLYQVVLPKQDVKYESTRYTESTGVDYPICHVLVTKENDGYFVGLSGYCSCPIYHTFNGGLEEMMTYFEPHAKDDSRASKAYKSHLLRLALDKAIKKLEVVDA